jgi:nickel/cobalt exporter
MRQKDIVALCVIWLLSASLTYAQSPLGIGTAEPAISVSGPLAPLFSWINSHQQSFYKALTSALRAMRQDPWALWSLIGLSFAYGVFHAAGPGHGKAVISSYMIANETQLRRGILISLLSALMQGLMAIVLVAATYLILRGTSISMTKATHWLEIASFSLVALFGAWLLIRKLLAMRKKPQVTPCAPATGMGSGLRFKGTKLPDHQQVDLGGNFCADCGKNHAVDPRLLGKKQFSLLDAWSAVLSVGLRPCSGAIIVLSFSLLNGLYLGGFLSVLAMSLGTAITVSILAILAVSAKDTALRFFGGTDRRTRILTNAIEIAAALFVLVIGLLLLGASL